MQRRDLSRLIARVPLQIPLISLWIILALPAAGQYRVVISGEVRNERGEPISSGVTVLLETVTGQMVGQQIADSYGRFEFTGAPPRADLYIKVNAEGFQPYRKELNWRSLGPRTLLNVTLSPIIELKPTPEMLPALTDTAAPKKARKEYKKAVQALKSKRLSEAQAHFEAAVAQYPCYARAQAYLAWILAQQHDPARAEAPLRKAIQCDRGYLPSYFLIGHILNEQKRFQETVEVLQEGLRLSPRAWYFHHLLGAAYFGLGNLVKAEEEFLLEQSLNPTPPPEYYLSLGSVYLAKHEYNKAYAAFEAYLRLAPEGSFAGPVKKRMAELESSGLVRRGSAAHTADLPPPPP